MRSLLRLPPFQRRGREALRVECLVLRSKASTWEPAFEPGEFPHGGFFFPQEERKEQFLSLDMTSLYP